MVCFSFKNLGRFCVYKQVFFSATFYYISRCSAFTKQNITIVKNIEFAKTQIDYILGFTGISFCKVPLYCHPATDNIIASNQSPSMICWLTQRQKYLDNYIYIPTYKKCF